MGEIAYRKIVAPRFGGAEVLRPVAATLSEPPPGYARLKVLAAGVGFTDLMARSGDYLLQRAVPFTPGYELVGDVHRGETSPHVGAVHPLMKAADVHAALERREITGKAVLVPE